mmetsp:Transcript_21689/g.25171  ORF Transcript_21689/g.25171 Transcript_21689/m.25171 type:complete len:116 (-) Transcript_21689:190-537(-)
MKINVHIKDKMFNINCGEGAQRIRWLGDVAIFRYDHFYGSLTGTPKGIRFENGTTLNMDDIINENLKEDQHVWVILKEDLEALGLDFKIKSTTKNSISKSARPKSGFGRQFISKP